jgi:hypothetical protein
MNFVFRLALACVITATHTGVAYSAKTRSVSQLEGLEYPQARKIILEYGWAPHKGGCLKNEGPEICGQFPELVNCTQGQPEFCILRFAKTRRCLQITTRGGYLEDNGGTSVDQVAFMNQKC